MHMIRREAAEAAAQAMPLAGYAELDEPVAGALLSR